MIAMFSFDGRALRRSTFALASVVALTACDSDAPVGPSSTTTSTPSAVNGAALVTPKLRWNVADMNGLVVGGAVFTWNGGKRPVTIADNSLLDLDKTLGKFEIAATGTGMVCPVKAPTGWVMPDTQCRGVGPFTGPVNFVASFFVLPEYSMIWHTNYSAGGLIGGATYTIKAKDGSYSATIVDNGKLDRWATLGSYFVQLPKGGEYELCQTTPPPGTLMYDAVCHAVTANFGTYTNGGIFVNWPLPQ
jgi:hypothetical protein